MFISLTVNSQILSYSNIQEARIKDINYMSSWCRVELKVDTSIYPKYKYARINKITTIINDQNENIKIYNELFPEKFNGYLNLFRNNLIEVKTKLSSRKATKITELSGEITLYYPNLSKGEIQRISNIQKRINKNLLVNTDSLQLFYTTKDSISAFEKRQKALKTSNFNTSSIDNLFFSSLEDRLTNLELKHAYFYQIGNLNKLIDLYFEDENGKRVPHEGYSNFGNMIAFSFKQNIGKDWKVVAVLDPISDFKTVPFTVKNIILP